MEAFSIGLTDEETKGNGDILDGEEPPYFDKEVTPKIPCHKTKIFKILVSIISIILIGGVAFVIIFIFFLRDKCDIENGYYVPADKTKEKKCLKCDLNCKTCYGNISQSQCNSCFFPFIPSFENDKIKFCNKKCEEGERNTCQTCDINKNECTSCNTGYFMPEDDERKVECQKCTVDYCNECSGTKNTNKCKACIGSYSPKYEGNEIIKCLCEVGEKEKCMKCDIDKNECIACNEGYRLLNGKCLSYSFKAIYNITSIEKPTYLISNYLSKNITYMIIDGNETKPCSEYVFSTPGSHKLFFFFDINQNASELDGMFKNIQNLVEISFTPKFNTQNITNMKEMFYDCQSLVSADLFSFNTKNLNYMYEMFYNCNSLKYINLSSFNTEKVYSMERLFYNCLSLESLDLSNFNTTNVYKMREMFSNCISLKSITQNFNGNNVDDISGIFQNCKSLTSINLTKFKSENIYFFSSAFYNCYSLTSIDLSGIKTRNARYMYEFFHGCKSLKSINVSHFETYKVKYMKSMFEGCISLISINITNFNVKNVKDASYMFSSCILLTSIDLSNFNLNKVENIEYMFANCSSLKSINISSFMSDFVKNIHGLFYNCSSLEYINLSNIDLDTYFSGDMSNMFFNCYSLKSIDLSRFSKKKLYNTEDMFYNCSSLTSIVLSNFDVVINNIIINGMFFNCASLTYVDISTFKTKLEKIYLFSNLPSHGEIVVKYNFYDKIKKQIPDGWNKTFI